MAKQKASPKSLIKKVMAEMGRKGGKKKVSKGLAMMTPERRAQIREKALATRRANKLRNASARKSANG